MSNEFAKASVRLVTAAVLMGSLAGCSTLESMDPTGWFGSDSDTAGGLSDAGQAATEDGTQPDVAAIPDKPQPTSDASQNAQVASSLTADAANVQYSAESLRGGTEAAAPAPSASAPAEQVAELAPPPAQTPAAQTPAANPPADVPADNTTPGTGTVTATTQPEAPAQPAAAPPPEDTAPSTGVPEPDQVATANPPAQPEPAPSPTTEAPAQPQPAPPPMAEAPAQPEPAPPPVAEAPAQSEPASSPDAAPPPAAQPVRVASAEPVPPVGPVPGAQRPVTRRAAIGFAPSSAPALDPSVSQFVAAPVIARYRQTAMLKPPVYPAYSGGSYGSATAVVTFPGDTTILDEKGLQQVRAAAELFKAHGGQGFVRIVGHASSASGKLSEERLMRINFDHSQARATAIARALMKEGVPADKVLVDAAAGTAGDANAEIFVQG